MSQLIKLKKCDVKGCREIEMCIERKEVKIVCKGASAVQILREERLKTGGSGLDTEFHRS